MFRKALNREYDAVVSMYHDQGMIPAKLVNSSTSVNVTMGLSIIRTSPDHGVAYDIAGSNRADETSLFHAVKLAAKMAGARL